MNSGIPPGGVSVSYFPHEADMKLVNRVVLRRPTFRHDILLKGLPRLESFPPERTVRYGRAGGEEISSSFRGESNFFI